MTQNIIPNIKLLYQEFKLIITINLNNKNMFLLKILSAKRWCWLLRHKHGGIYNYKGSKSGMWF